MVKGDCVPSGRLKFCFWLALSIVILIFFALWFWNRNVILDGEVYPRNVTVLRLKQMPENLDALGRFPSLRWLDLRGGGIGAEEAGAVRNAVPGCHVLWSLDFQGRAVDAGSHRLTLDHLTEAEAELLDSMNQLEQVDALECRDYQALRTLMAHHPDCRVDYQVPLGGTLWNCREDTLTPGECSAVEIEEALSLLPRIRRVDLRETGLSHAESAALAREHPHVRFLWNAEVCGITIPTNAAELELSGIPMENTEAVESALEWFPEVRRVILCDCGIPSPEIAAMGERHPEIRFVWRVKLGPLSARTDDTWFAPITKRQLIGGHDADELKYCIDMECIDLGHCWISDCEWARNMPKLRYLVLADSYVKDLSPLSDLKNLTYLELFVTPVKDYSPLMGCTGLEDLNLGYTSGDPSPIAKMTWLKNLWWGGIRSVPWADGQSPDQLLRRNLPNTRITLYSGSSTGLGWRTLPHYYEMRDRIGMYYMVG